MRAGVLDTGALVDTGVSGLRDAAEVQKARLCESELLELIEEWLRTEQGELSEILDQPSCGFRVWARLAHELIEDAVSEPHRSHTLIRTALETHPHERGPTAVALGKSLSGRGSVAETEWALSEVLALGGQGAQLYRELAQQGGYEHSELLEVVEASLAVSRA